MKCYLIFGNDKYKFEATRFIPRVGEIINLGGVAKVIVKSVEYEYQPSTGELIEINIIVHYHYVP